MNKEIIKQNILNILRKSKLLYFENQLMYYINIIRTYSDNKRFIAEHPSVKFPPYHIAYDAFNTCHHRFYYDYGFKMAKSIVDIIRNVKQGNLVVCEWGCGPARVIQHLKALDAGITDLIGTDYNLKTIEWCKASFPDIKFIANQLEPPLALETNSIDVLYCWSVFTHLSEEMHYAWMAEIKRVLKPEGLFIGTFHGDYFMNKLLPYELASYLKGDIVTRGMVKEGSKNYVAFHPDSFVKTQLLKDFHNVLKMDSAMSEQSIWCAKAP